MCMCICFQIQYADALIAVHGKYRNRVREKKTFEIPSQVISRKIITFAAKEMSIEASRGGGGGGVCAPLIPENNALISPDS